MISAFSFGSGNRKNCNDNSSPWKNIKCVSNLWHDEVGNWTEPLGVNWVQVSGAVSQVKCSNVMLCDNSLLATCFNPIEKIKSTVSLGRNVSPFKNHAFLILSLAIWLSRLSTVVLSLRKSNLSKLFSFYANPQECRQNDHRMIWCDIIISITFFLFYDSRKER